jgi:AcrR family transcriptional regulator
MESIAVESGFAVQTVYFHFKSKAAILSQLIDGLLADQVVPRHERAMSSASPAQQLRMHAEIARQTYDNGWDLLQALTSAGRTDRGLAARLRDWQRGYLSGLTASVLRLSLRRSIRPGLDEPTAVDIAWALTSPELYRLLVVNRGWDGATYEQWLGEVLIGQLLGTDRAARSATAAARRTGPPPRKT